MPPLHDHAATPVAHGVVVTGHAHASAVVELRGIEPLASTLRT